ncbi:hypothetical protein BOX15_Mlig027787g1 [Macrostomum lignano]|uniref:SMP-LTD domain-containing protein n=1 Tax=Macrostomum lignano TaxID=282301 RepID=A0A267GDR5_9PLAT|nr:hypothetical protein BOX15_Mlig027787g1 [Macrostomum lignano]
MDSRRKAASGGGLSSQTFKFSALRDTGDDDDMDFSPSSSPPRHQQPAATSGKTGVGGGGSFEDLLNAVPKPQTKPRPPSAFARQSTVATAAQPPPSSSPPPPPPSQPPPPPPPPLSLSSAPSKIATDSSKPLIGSDNLDADVEENDELEEDNNEERTPVAASSGAQLPAAAPEPWPFSPDESSQPDVRVIRTDAPPPNPLAQKLPLLFTLLAAALSIVLATPLPLPDLAKGLVIGCSLTCCLLVYFYLEFLANRPVVVHYTGVKYCRNPRASVLTAAIAATSPAAAAARCSRKQQQTNRSLDGFLNECWSYDVERHHLNHTFTVYASLDGRQLTLKRPQQSVPKRVLYSDELINPDMLSFSDTREFDLANAKLRLQPVGLVRKRLWSKKYPIHVVLASNSPAKTFVSTGKSDTKFEQVQASDCVQRDLYLFARTSREKELWYRRLYAACNGLPQAESLYKSAVTDPSAGGATGRSTLSSFGDQAKRYSEYAAAFTRFADISEVQLGSADKPELNFLNALLQRATWDVFRTPYWADLIKAKMDARLKKIRLPYFIEELSVDAVHVGSALPVLRKLHKPHINDRGIWFHLDIDYPGGCSASLVTRINLHRLQGRGGAQTGGHEESAAGARVVSSASADSIASAPSPPPSTAASSPGAGPCPFTDSIPQRLAATNSEMEDSGESTTDESGGQSDADSDTDDPALGNVGGKHSRKVIKFIDKVAQSEKFHHLMGKYKFFRKAVDSVSNTRILLSVDVHSLRGTLVLNMPFPPSDRVWVAFHPVPQLVLTSRPKIGEKEFTARKISDLISKKLVAEFHRVFVLPNMEDLYLPTLNSDEALLASAPPAEAAATAASSLSVNVGFQSSASTNSL